MPAGRPPKPDAIRELQGNPGKRPLRKRSARPAVRLPNPPEHLPPPARAEWRRVGEQLRTLGLISDVARAALVVYCVAWTRHKQASLAIEREGAVIYVPEHTDNKGRPWPARWDTSPWVAIERSAADQMLKAMREFGMTPSSFTKAAAAEPEQEATPLMRLLQGGKQTAGGPDARR